MAGYIGTTPVPQATQHRESFTATGGQTSFATVGYTPQFIDVYLNGVKLAPADFTATNGSDVVLASGATASDILEIVAYTPFEVANQTFTGTTTAANLTVTGAFTSQGIDDNANAVAITIDSSENVGIGTSSPSNSLTVNSGTTNVVAKFISTDADAQIHFEDNSTTDIVGIGATGDNLEYRTDQGVHLFRTGNSAAERMRIDSSGNVGIGGITSLSDKLHLRTATGSVGLRFSVDDAGDFRIVNDGSSNLTFISGASTERMRIDSSGNLLVGKTSAAGASTVGAEMRPDGDLISTRASAQPLTLNRTTSDGTIAQFRKDNTTVGSIGAYSGDLTIGDGDIGIRFDTGTGLVPWNVATNSSTNGTSDLGASTARFKDLYLSGGVFLGGTGSANKLDDYEEGTWTATLVFATSSGSLNYNNNTLRYCKVGNLVFIAGNISWTANNYTANTGAMRLEGLPFTTTTQNDRRGGIAIQYSSQPWTGLTIYQQAFREEISDNHLIFNYSNATDGRMDSEIGSYTSINSSGTIFVSGCYFTE